ncbi:hypothetical protein [Candidatus Phyllobacterium onerii]|uniref:hypothetical protein n=1 Tax=Candidatus Phyllobacterium onerii TaxID=3020828 RepID=UPI0023310803|nr:hypothetical protein [Phyllobacterium sp. IY22]
MSKRALERDASQSLAARNTDNELVGKLKSEANYRQRHFYVRRNTIQARSASHPNDPSLTDNLHHWLDECSRKMGQGARPDDEADVQASVEIHR